LRGKENAEEPEVAEFSRRVLGQEEADSPQGMTNKEDGMAKMKSYRQV
jgi:hypothetical protein